MHTLPTRSWIGTLVAIITTSSADAPEGETKLHPRPLIPQGSNWRRFREPILTISLTVIAAELGRRRAFVASRSTRDPPQGKPAAEAGIRAAGTERSETLLGQQAQID
jgi:hypothetical protein